MLRPARMAKLTILSSRQALRPVVEALYALRAVHLVDFSEGRDPAFEGFRIGKPLPEGPAASDRLVRVRALSRHLQLERHEPATRHPAREVERKLDARIHELELNVTGAAESRARLQAGIAALEAERAALGPLAALPLRLEDYHGYRSLAVLVGRGVGDAAAALRAARLDAEVFQAGGAAFAAFVPRAEAARAAEALERAGLQLGEPPRGQGSVAERLDAIARELQQLQHRLQAAEEELARLRREAADFLVAAEEHLTIQSEKAEAPLRFASSAYAFVVEGWVPEEQVEAVRGALRRAAGEAFHLEVERPEDLLHPAPAPAAPAQGEAAWAGAGGPEEAAEHGPHPARTPPTKFEHARPFRPFRMFTEMVSIPRYGEIDPTPVLALVLPLFLGFMIGDAGYGLLMLLLGAWLARRFGRRISEARDLGIALGAAGIVSLGFGAVVFADAFGIPLGIHEHGVGCAAFVAEHKETTWSCITGLQVLDGVTPLLAKLRDIGDLLVISVLAAFVHMGLGLSFGVANAWGHSRRHVVAKLGWLALMVAFFVQILFMARANRIAGAVYAGLGLPEATIPVMGVAIHVVLLGGVLLAVVLLAVGEGPISVLELPTMLSNLMSYTRLAGLAIAKGAMAAAFTSLTLVDRVYGAPGGALGLALALVGLVLFVFTQAFVFVLGVFSSAIQAIRLNYVEFFNKFYEGGGIPFTVFGRTRTYTQEA